MGCVYCHQQASDDCFKVGRTKHPASNKRLKSLSTGSSKKLSIYREITTDHPALLETRIHHLLDASRAENGEFFNVSKVQLDSAVKAAEEFLAENLPIIHQAAKLQRQKPKTQDVLLPTDAIKTLHRELKEAVGQAFFLEQRIQVLQSKLQIAIGDNIGIDGVASWKWREMMRLNSSLFKKEEPELFKKYQRPSASRVFHLLRG